MKIKEYVKRNSDLNNYGYHKEDMLRIIKVMKSIDVDISIKEVNMLWNMYSDDYCACWLGLPESDEELKEIIINTAIKYIDNLED